MAHGGNPVYLPEGKVPRGWDYALWLWAGAVRARGGQWRPVRHHMA